jgi:hypothetical protein
MLPGAAITGVPYVPAWFELFDPLIQVHWPALYFHRSLKKVSDMAEPGPIPPKSQKFPEASVQVTG